MVRQPSALRRSAQVFQRRQKALLQLAHLVQSFGAGLGRHFQQLAAESYQWHSGISILVIDVRNGRVSFTGPAEELKDEAKLREVYL